MIWTCKLRYRHNLKRLCASTPTPEHHQPRIRSLGIWISCDEEPHGNKGHGCLVKYLITCAVIKRARNIFALKLANCLHKLSKSDLLLTLKILAAFGPLFHPEVTKHPFRLRRIGYRLRFIVQSIKLRHRRKV